MGNKTITSDAYILSTNKATIINDIFLIFLNYCKNNVTDITSWHGSFPDLNLTDKASYPVGIVNMPEMNWTDFTQTKLKAPGTIKIELFDTRKVDIMTNMSDLTNSIESKRTNLRSMKLNKIRLDSMDQDTFFHGELKVHTASATFSFLYTFTGTL